MCHTTHEYWLMDAVGSSAKVTTEKRLKRFASDFGLPAGLPAEYRSAVARTAERGLLASPAC
ncbi:hypothetical protein ACH46N_01075 [Streptomyces pristinaespiralis]|uniref:Carboxylesterase n=2 Tax=Streptomyces pristinaespiralis TaxID=38300 RepID=B5HFS3_STRE2|nr:hypothetical protein [Streptomyces pristinaespiralis]ALC19841.1 carboxylesterase [Streptomyces pristinaespiralis]EDY65684.1 carboxylesterase [Streptomyces pristinaespiralis ATCC 25486]QMU18837.1 hypothetical protein H3L99_29280 [Streptomyces pristinaespiralis]